jgi:hypothetical protein
MILGPTNLPEKCFLKCFGEGTGMVISIIIAVSLKKIIIIFYPFQIINGKVNEAKIIAQFASLSVGDVDKLMDMYGTFQFCSNMTSSVLNEIQK